MCFDTGLSIFSGWYCVFLTEGNRIYRNPSSRKANLKIDSAHDMSTPTIEGKAVVLRM